jgi:hypothetical protein
MKLAEQYLKMCEQGESRGYTTKHGNKITARFGNGGGGKGIIFPSLDFFVNGRSFLTLLDMGSFFKVLKEFEKIERTEENAEDEIDALEYLPHKL